MKYQTLKFLALGALLIGAPALAAAPDGYLTSKAKLSLWTAAGLKSTTVHVDTNDGVITLYGRVANAEQKATAERTARAIEGVRGVNNLLQVVPESAENRVAADDKALTALVGKRLSADPALKDSHISVKSVDKGMVLLTGEANSFSDHLRAVAIADRTPGVRRVASEVHGPDAFGNDERVIFLNEPAARVRADAKHARSSATDLKVTTDVKLRLLTTSQIPSGEISVDTEDGVVTLFGIVPTTEVKNAAGREAGKADGVARVINQLEVVASAQKPAVEAKDADITRDLASAFKDRPSLKNVSTEVKNGTVRLTGTVANGWDHVAAVRAARMCAGVRGVEDQLKVE